MNGYMQLKYQLTLTSFGTLSISLLCPLLFPYRYDHYLPITCIPIIYCIVSFLIFPTNCIRNTVYFLALPFTLSPLHLLYR